MRVHKQQRPQQRESKAQWRVVSVRWQPEIRNMTAPRKSAYAEWTPSLEISEDLYGRGGRDTFASQTHHRERCPHHLHQQSVGISNLNQQFESAVDISSESAAHISRPQKTSHKWWNDCMDLNNTKVVKSYTGEGLSSTMLPPLYLYQRSVDINLSISSKLRLQPMHVQAAGAPPWQIVNMWERHTANELNQTNCTNPKTQGHTNTHQPNQ